MKLVCGCGYVFDEACGVYGCPNCNGDRALRSPPVEVDTSPYERSHRKAPRGRGSWAFDLDGERRFAVDLFWHNGTYAEARRAAVKAARALGSSVVRVQS